jgi:hypothetical protein
MASGTFGSGCLRGAGYDDQNNNADYYRNGVGAEDREPACREELHLN